MKFFRLKKVKGFKKPSFEDIKFKVLTRTKHISISLDKYEPKSKTPFMYKDRPENGKEILILLQGRIKIRTKDRTEIFDVDKEGPVLVIVNAKEYRQYENIGDKEARILALFSPPFSLKEVEHIMDSNSS